MLKLKRNHVSCPDLYNHVHYFKLLDETLVEFAVGGVASVILEGKCKYEIEEIELNKQSNILFSHQIILSEFKFEKNTSYYEHINDAEALTKRVKFFEERGTFLFVDCGDMYNDPEEEGDLPCIKFDKRIVFESDPLFLFDDQYNYSAYGRMNYPPFHHKRLPNNYYYIECTGRYKLKDLRSLGLNMIKY
jgi:hypothetical protein